MLPEGNLNIAEENMSCPSPKFHPVVKMAYF
jgi:hypothetical protein